MSNSVIPFQWGRPWDVAESFRNKSGPVVVKYYHYYNNCFQGQECKLQLNIFCLEYVTNFTALWWATSLNYILSSCDLKAFQNRKPVNLPHTEVFWSNLTGQMSDRSRHRQAALRSLKYENQTPANWPRPRGVLSPSTRAPDTSCGSSCDCWLVFIVAFQFCRNQFLFSMPPSVYEGVDIFPALFIFERFFFFLCLLSLF